MLNSDTPGKCIFFFFALAVFPLDAFLILTPSSGTLDATVSLTFHTLRAQVTT